jgi:hypothetical protein
VLAIAGYLYYSGMLNVPGLTTEATYVGVSYSSNIQTASPSISACNVTINVETYKTTVSKIAPPPTCRVYNSTRNTFMQKLGQYGVTVSFYSSMTIRNNATGEIYFQRVFNFTSGEDRKIEVLILNPIPENTTLRIDIHIEIHVTSTRFTWSKVIDRTIYTKSGSACTPSKPYTSISGTLVNTTSGLALQLKSEEWCKPTMSFTSPTITIYLTYHGQRVTDLSVLGLTNDIIGKYVTVSGYISKDSYGDIYIEVERITEISIQG